MKLIHFILLAVLCSLHNAVMAMPIIAEVGPLPALPDEEDRFRLTWRDIDSPDFHVEWKTDELRGDFSAIVVIGAGNSVSTSFTPAAGKADFTRTGSSDYAIRIGFSDIVATGSFDLFWFQTDGAGNEIPNTRGTYKDGTGNIRNEPVGVPEPPTLLLLIAGIVGFLLIQFRRHSSYDNIVENCT
ncbi:PEP-CTERM sorting domain-containing protein [Nitrococcus mobilis]|uniref:PEP-CTERM sorting domain-containing protein n=1 Tax=Nitrococcus mobilis TaxID=35797 RepID=UPI000A06BB6D|nr:PEP-CTERM sorting domain-containing protein [Nitrococcus mobilis]